ncbi:hypothetical protein [Caballeronia sp. HLA56]
MDTSDANHEGVPTPSGTAGIERSRLIAFAKRRWLAILGTVIVIWIGSAGYFNRSSLGTNAGPCISYALAQTSDATQCRKNLEHAIYSVPRNDAEPRPLFEVTIPAALMWIDNLFVDAYTLFFIASAGLAYKKLTGVRSEPMALWRLALTCTCVLALLGALADHVENFWILAYMEPRSQGLPNPSDTELSRVAWVSALKFQFFVLNGAVNAIWWTRVVFIRVWEQGRYAELAALLAEGEEGSLYESSA